MKLTVFNANLRALKCFVDPKEFSRPYLCGIYVERITENRVVMVATQGTILAAYFHERLDSEPYPANWQPKILPLFPVSTKDAFVELDLSEDRAFRVTDGAARYAGEYIEGAYPPFAPLFSIDAKPDVANFDLALFERIHKAQKILRAKRVYLTQRGSGYPSVWKIREDFHGVIQPLRD